MKKNNLTNQKLISAMLVGISAMMSISSPITAYAQDDENNIPDITPETAETSENENTQSPSEESVTAEAQELAAETTEAIEEASETLETIENVEEASIESLETAAEKIDEVETALVEADQADVAADKAAAEMVENVDEAVKVAESAQESAQEAKEQVEDLVEDITTAESAEDAQKSYDELVKVIEDTSFDINAKKEYFNKLNDKYEEAKERLVQAEADYEAALNDASDDATDAREELEKAQAEVDTLGTIVEETKEKMEAQVEPAKEIKDSADKVVVDWGPQRNFMYTIIREYYIPQLVDSGATDIKVEKYVKGYDTQDYNYNIITYKDSNGQKQTLYFNYDRADKYINEKNRYDGKALGSSTDIVIFEKTQEEIDANDYLKKYFAAHPTNENIRNMANAGKLDVFAYVEDGKTQFMVRKELEDALENGDITIDQDGKLYIGEAEIHEVVQNQNSKVHGGTNVVDTSDQAFIDFYTKAQERVDTYTNYEVAVENAGNAVDEAVEKAEQLEDAIDTLKDNRTNRIVKATEVLGVDDIAAYLNIEVTSEEANLLNNMTLNQAIRYLDRKLSEAKDKVAEAQADLDIILEQKKAGKAEYEAVVAKYSTAPEEEKEPEVKAEEKAETEENTEEIIAENKTENATAEEDLFTDIEEAEVPLAPAPVVAEENVEVAENEAAAEDQNEEAAEITLPAGSTIQFIYVADTNDQNTDDDQAPAYVAPEAFVVDGSMINIEDQITPLAAEMAVINEAEAADNTANEAAVEDANDDTYTQIDDENVPSAAEMVANDVVKNTEQAFVSIEDEDTALADTFTEAKEEKTSLWWLILIAVLGTAGEEMYRRHKEKEAENSK
ncbi:hypothetical protein SAMN02910276_02257 [Butyrivibrio sp. Su6]|uniref:hypothetical protein n=1 Tax=Butyrivibrio sp. Su6 TaxID=1520810 RepID=UPI00089EB0A3|nr:hypothetical protein [Butyrivibrio sp. Su6]SEG23935.1 hypothetical protein SAMN02910276_02257 [Butyrivibrio sp. Su6]